MFVWLSQNKHQFSHFESFCIFRLGAWKRRGHPDSHGEAGNVGPFGSMLGSRSVLDAVVEEEMSEEEDEEEDSIAVLDHHEEDKNSGQAAMILVHDSRSSSSSNAPKRKMQNYSKLFKMTEIMIIL